MALISELFILFLFIIQLTYSFDIGVKGTKCSLESHNYNNPCASLYDAECDGEHCKCPSGTHEDKTLKRCMPGAPKKKTGGGGDDLFDLPFDYNPNQKATTKAPKPKTPPIINPAQPQPGYPNQPQPGYPNQPQPGYPNQPQPGYPNQPQPGYPNQPQPGYPNQPGYNNPNQPGGYPTNKHGKSSGDPHLGEKAGGGVGGIAGLILLVGLLYCCCKGGKHKDIMNKLPFMKGGQAGGAQPGGVYQMQQQPQMMDPSQQTYVPPGQPMGPPMGQPMPMGQPTHEGQPPPYTTNYQPTAPAV